MTAPAYFRNTLVACGFLSRLPIPASVHENRAGGMAEIAHTFAPAGLLIALPPALLLLLLLAAGADPLMAALLALGAQTLVTGALHEDGLADCADGFGGGRDREHALAIMKDSRIGAYGTIALILSFGLRAAAIAALARALTPLAAAACLPAVAAYSRALMVAHWQALPSAREAGLAASLGRPDLSTAASALAAGAVSAGILVLAALSLPALFLLLVLPAAGAYGLTRLAGRRIGGHTGDTIGATQQVGEIAGLCALALAA